MNTFLITSQLVCYGLSIVSATVNIARFVRHRRSKARRRVRPGLSIGLTVGGKASVGTCVETCVGAGH